MEGRSEYFHGDYVVWLQVDDGGVVKASRIVKTPPGLRVRRDLRSEIDDFLGQVEAWSQGVVVEPVISSVDGPIDAALSVILRNGPSGWDIISYEPEQDGWQEVFYSAYRLEQGRTIKLLPGQPIPERSAFLRAVHPDITRRNPSGPSVLGLQVVEGELDEERIRVQCFGGCQMLAPDSGSVQLRGALGVIANLLQTEIRIEEGVVSIGNGDFVVSAEASGEELLDDFLLEAERITGVPLDWERVIDSELSIVLRGSLGEIQREPKLQDRRVVHLFVGELEDDLEVSSGLAMGEDADPIRRFLASTLNMPVIDETVGPPVEGGYTVRVDQSAMRTEQRDQLLANLEGQTDLDIDVMERPIERIVIRPQE
ncbi:MAG: hypothetical protein AAGK22_09375 [Acidobacteriota bacterium]